LGKDKFFWRKIISFHESSLLLAKEDFF